MKKSGGGSQKGRIWLITKKVFKEKESGTRAQNDTVRAALTDDFTAALTAYIAVRPFLQQRLQVRHAPSPSSQVDVDHISV